MSILNPSTPLYAPVVGLPQLTAGRNTSGYVVGHEPKYVLDNNPDTWWTPDVFTDSAIYVDFGVSTKIDAIAMWIHNYNADFPADAGWQVSYSYDDSTYVPLGVKTLVGYRTGYTPVVVDVLSPVPTAQYWKVEFVNFDSMPTSEKPEISAMWFMDDYSLPWKAQPATEDKAIYHGSRIINPSNTVSSVAHSVGQQRIIDRRFILRTDETWYGTTDHCWHKLAAAYTASHGCLPIVIKPNITDAHFRVVTFETAFSENRVEHDNYQPQITLRELGFKRVPYYDKTANPSASIFGLWHFRDALTDSSGNGYTWNYSAGVLSYVAGVTEKGNTAISIPQNGYIGFTGDTANALNMDTNDFTIIAWWRGTSEISNARIIQNTFYTPTPSTGGYFIGSTHGNKLRCSIGDHLGNVATVVNQGPVISGNAVNDSNTGWHQIAMTVNRTLNELKAYVDGVQIGSTVSISHITGNINRTPLDYPAGVNFGAALQCILDEMVIIKGVALPATAILTNYTGKANYGTWGI